jgi:uncharacterized protein (DUF885 family)
MPEFARSQELLDLGEEFFDVQNRADPLSISLLGVQGYDDLLPDPSRDAATRVAGQLRSIEERVAALDVATLNDADRVDAAVLARLAWGARVDLEEGIWEADAGSEGYFSPPAMVFMCVPSVTVDSDASRDGYLKRLRGLGDYFDAIRGRFVQARADDRHSTRAGLLRAVDQLRGHLALPIEEDLLANPPLGDGYDGAAFLSESRGVVLTMVRPAMDRLAAYMEGPMMESARDDEHVGIRFVPGGEASYKLAVRRQTTTDLTPDEIHQIGLERIAGLQHEWKELGERVLGETDVPTILTRLREDTTLRFETSAEIIKVAQDALDRAEAARDDWFPPYRIAPCIVEEVHPIEARNAALAHYVPPTADGSRPGAHWILTLEPEKRFRYEYEALSFHESSPGHHLQIATAQTLSELPRYRRYLDAQACAFIEGWGLYSERLADEMGLYTSDLARLGMLSFDALRACRLVVDTGMHHLGWSRQQAIDFMWSNTATTMGNVTNEIDRYIGWPAQALAYMIGRREIERLRRVATEQLGDTFDIRGFHGAVLGNGAVPLTVLEQNVLAWIDASTTPSATKN